MCIKCVIKKVVDVEEVEEVLGTATAEQLQQIKDSEAAHDQLKAEIRQELDKAMAAAKAKYEAQSKELEAAHEALWKDIVTGIGHTYDPEITYGVDRKTGVVSVERLVPKAENEVHA